MYLEQLSVAGFRGVGSHLEFPLGKRTIFYGPNGSGKSSILQAIPWTIYGKLPGFAGGVFTREDALVNDFLVEGEAEISLALSGDITITRTRAKRKSTTRGKNPLVVPFNTDSPQAALEQLVHLSLEEFFAAVFLHQETIREFITSTPETRSAAIDRMLGTYLLRTLIKVVDPKVPAKAIANAEDATKQLERQLSQASVISREVIQARKEEHGDPAELPQLLEHIRNDLAPISETLALPVPEASLPGLQSSLTAADHAQLHTIRTLEQKVGQLGGLKERYEQTAITGRQLIQERKDRHGGPDGLPDLLEGILQDATPIAQNLNLPIPNATIGGLERTLTAIPRAQLTVSSGLEKRAAQLDTLGERYQHVSADVIETLSLPGELETRRTQLQGRISTLNRDIPRLTRQHSQRQAALQELGQLRREVEALPAVHDQIKETQRKLEQLEQASKQGAVYNQILAAGQEYLSGTLPEHCPLCKQSIEDIQALLEILRQETPAHVEKMEGERRTARTALTHTQERATQLERKHTRIEELQMALAQLPEGLGAQIEERQDKVEKLANDLTTVEAEIAQIEGRIRLAANYRRRVTDALREIERALAHPPGEDVPGALEQEAQVLRTQAAKVQAIDIEPVTSRLARAKELTQIRQDELQLQRQLDSLLPEIERALAHPPGEDVPGALEHETQALRTQAAEVQALNFTPIASEMGRAMQLDEIRKDEARLRQLESSYQTANLQKARLAHRIRRLSALRNALQDIAETTKRHQRAIVIGLLTSLDIDCYYQQLDPHPAYRQLQIEPELTSKGTYNYWIRALTDDRSHGTYVQTRFSTSQANCAAIAIFLAVNQHLSKKLETIILDDPSQSMDPERKQRLAHTLATIPRQVIVATEDPQMFEFLADAFETPTVHRLAPWSEGGAALVG